MAYRIMQTVLNRVGVVLESASEFVCIQRDGGEEPVWMLALIGCIPPPAGTRVLYQVVAGQVARPVPLKDYVATYCNTGADVLLIQIEIRTGCTSVDKTLSLAAHACDTIEILKAQVEDVEGISAREQVLTYRSTQLMSGTLSSNGVQDGSVLRLLWRPLLPLQDSRTFKNVMALADSEDERCILVARDCHFYEPEHQLGTYFAQFGPIVKTTVPVRTDERGRATPQLRWGSMGFIVFESVVSVESALAQQPHVISQVIVPVMRFNKRA